MPALETGEEAVGHMRHDDVGGGVTKLASESGERVDRDAFRSWSRYESL